MDESTNLITLKFELLLQRLEKSFSPQTNLTINNPSTKLYKLVLKDLWTASEHKNTTYDGGRNNVHKKLTFYLKLDFGWMDLNPCPALTKRSLEVL